MYNICRNTNPIQRRAIIKKTKELKILKFLTKEYHMFEQLGSLKREKSKRILVRSVDGLVVAGFDGVELFGSYKKERNGCYSS